MNLICISGSSGVGKTTISRIIQSVLGTKDCLCLSGDDLHKWERGNPIWKTITHLNPDANDLELGYTHLSELKQGRSIQRNFYNHDTGKFDSAVTIEPKSNIIYEGLHALYHKPTLEMSDLSIYVDTDEDLKIEWKFKRDTKKRGYSQSEVLDALQRRQGDENNFITPQKHNADVIVKFTKDQHYAISLLYFSVTGKGEAFMKLVKDFYESASQFLQICKWLGLDPSLVQERGGNVSVKSDGGMIIKSSGAKMGDINLYHGFCVCDINCQAITAFTDEIHYNTYINSSKKIGESRPSMETGFHISLPNKVVIHTHPVHLNALLCSIEGEGLLKTLFKDISYEFVEYTTPGYELVNRIIPKQTGNNVLFLQNHGLIVGAETHEDAMEITEKINNRCKRWLVNHVDSLLDFEDSKINLPLFPDAAVFPNEMSSTNNYILHLMTGACLTPNFLSSEEVQKLNNLSSEQFRKALV
jgi:uridine kinase/ribulose-5-phosphate 4-epimerase/fuculose-1-phosphate aldolase